MNNLPIFRYGQQTPAPNRIFNVIIPLLNISLLYLSPSIKDPISAGTGDEDISVSLREIDELEDDYKITSYSARRRGPGYAASLRFNGSRQSFTVVIYVGQPTNDIVGFVGRAGVSKLGSASRQASASIAIDSPSSLRGTFYTWDNWNAELNYQKEYEGTGQAEFSATNSDSRLSLKFDFTCIRKRSSGEKQRIRVSGSANGLKL